MTSVRKTKKLILSYDNLLMLFLTVVYFIDASCIGLIPVRNKLRLLEGIALVAVVFVAFMLISKRGRKFLKESPYVSMYMVVDLLICVIISIFSIRKYDENIFDAYISSVPFLLFFLVPLVAYIMQKNPQTMRKMLRIMLFIGVSTTCVILIQGLCYSFGIPYILPGSYQFGGYRYGRIRLAMTNICRFGIFYMLYRFFTSKTNRMIYGVFACIGLFVSFYYVSTRMDTIAWVACIVVMLFFAGSKKPLYRVLLIIAFVLFLIYGYADVLIESFSSKGDMAGSTLARIGAIDYFSSFFRENPIFSMGFVRPRSAYLRRIWSGPRGIYYFSDLGAYGHLLQYGLIGSILYILPLARMIYIAIKLYRNGRSEGLWALGAMTYIVVSQISLNYTEYMRGLGSVAYWAVLETLYRGKEFSFSNEVPQMDASQKEQE